MTAERTLQVSPRIRQVAEKQLVEREPRQQPTKPVTTVKGSALHDLQLRAVVEGHSFISDEAAHGGGHDAGPAPLRYFLAGAMMCHQVWTIKSAALASIALTALDGEIAGYVGPTVDDPRTDAVTFVRISFGVSINSDAPDEAIIAVVDEAARRCPAFSTLARSTPIDLRLEHNGTLIHTQTYAPADPPR
jgi:uncharacterized OsmC-like protein